MTDRQKNFSSESTGPHNVKLKDWISCAPFEQLLNMKIIKAENGKAILTMPFYYDYAQGAGLMHGGAIVSLADTAVVMAIKSILPPQTHFATISLSSKFLYPLKKGNVTARAEAKIEGERTIQGTATVYNDDERPVLEFYSTFKIARHRRIKNNS
ncbi:MAG: PaaI family thioesterase [Desulfobacteraceae bacterium]|nr:PaaI family thioesterase [Desulfobacteraceae bacterium]MBC2754745.1 PaaI family thioesterase [Desulfobacteraceae bacterium]